jgi:FkbM family methyltransferase
MHDGLAKEDGLRVRVRSVFRRVFHLLLDRLGLRRFKEHSFFGTLLAQPAVVADFGAHRGEFFAALKAEYPVSQALLIEADPALAESLKETFGNEGDVLHAALVGDNKGPTIIFTRSTEPEASSIFSERVAVYGVVTQIKVPTVDFAEALRLLDGRVDLAKLDIEGAEVEVLQTARPSDLASCSQLTVEFHDKSQPVTRRDVDRLCQRMRCEGYGIVNANWPYVDDVMFVNLRRIGAGRRWRFRRRMALVNGLFVLRGAFFWSVRLLKRIRWAVKRRTGDNHACNGIDFIP